jgi:beta-lactamase class A
MEVMRSIAFSIFVLLFLFVGFSDSAEAPADAPEPVADTPSTGSTMRPDAAMDLQLEALVSRLHLDREAREQKLAISLVDITDLSKPRYAGLNDTCMMYAASLPKIAILLAGFEKIRAGELAYTPQIREMFTRIARVSSNTDASRAVQMIGFETIAKTLTSSRYQLYDPSKNGGLWVGKAYGGPSDYWKRDPLHNLSHGATTLQTARFFTMLAQGLLVSPAFSRELKEILGHPGINHKFVKGLSGKPGVMIYRKSGTWKDWHADAALIEHNGRRYVAAALMESPKGGEALERLIVGLDEIITKANPGI